MLEANGDWKPFGKMPEAKASGEKSTISQADINGQASPHFNSYSLSMEGLEGAGYYKGERRSSEVQHRCKQCIQTNYLKEETEIGS